MNEQEFKNLRASVEGVFAALYLIDINTLTVEQRRQHQQVLAVAYLALVNAEHARFSQLTLHAKSQLTDLSEHLHRMQQDVSGLATPHEKLEVVAQGLGSLGRLAQLL